MRRLTMTVNNCLLVYIMLLQNSLSNFNEAYGQLILSSDQVAIEGDTEVVMSCDYSKVVSEVQDIKWDEVNEDGSLNVSGIVNDKKTVSGRYTLRTTQKGKADLVISNPVRNDNQRRFQCEMYLKAQDEHIYSDQPSVLIVYYLDDPVLTTSAISVSEGKSVTLSCSMPDGYPAPNITWYKDGLVWITTNTNKFNKSDDGLEIKIKHATADDSGNYMCKAENDGFKYNDGKISNRVSLDVNLGVKDNDVSGSTWYVPFIVVGVILFLLWIAFLLYYIFVKKIETTEEVEDRLLGISTRFRPSIANFEIIQWDNQNQSIDTREFKPPKLCSSTQYFFKYVLRCCTYFCGTCCKEYHNTWKQSENVAGNGERQSTVCEEIICDGETHPGETCTFSNGRISLKNPNEYICTIVRRGKQYVHSNPTKIIPKTTYEATCGEDTELKCTCGPPQSQVIWKKFAEDGTRNSISDNDQHYTTTTDDGGCTMKIVNFASDDAGKYQCSFIQTGERRHIHEYILKERSQVVVVGGESSTECPVTSADPQEGSQAEAVGCESSTQCPETSGVSQERSQLEFVGGGSSKECPVTSDDPQEGSEAGAVSDESSTQCPETYGISQAGMTEIVEAELGSDVELRSDCGPPLSSNPIWKKKAVDGTYNIISDDLRFQTTTENEECMLKIVKFSSEDAGNYCCTFQKDRKIHKDEKILIAKRHRHRHSRVINKELTDTYKDRFDHVMNELECR